MGGRTIIKNTGFLYVRMIVMLVIAFYSSRILLKELGIDNYGIYNIVGGVVAMFASLRGAFASSIQRFLNYAKGEGAHQRLGKIFSMGVNIHALICLVFILIAETLGLWFLNYKLVIPPAHMYAANWVFQLSIAASLVTIMTIPYDAVIIANQKMAIYMYITSLEALLNLSIIFILPLVAMDNLILYSLLILCVSFIIRIITTIYCSKKFEECKYVFIWDKTLFKELGAFAGWNFLGNTAFSIANEGSNILLNLFGGVVANAARGITYQLRSALEKFVNNLQIAINPHLTELYAQKKYKDFFEIFFSMSKLAFFIMTILCIPIIMYTKFILNIWLHTVPEYTVHFIQLVMFFLLIRVFHGPIDSVFKAVGNIKKYQIIDSITLLLSLPFSYLLLKWGFSLYCVYISIIIFEVVNLISILLLINKQVDFDILKYFKIVIAPVIISFVIIFLSAFFIKRNIVLYSLWMFILLVAFNSIFSCFIIWLIGFNKRERFFFKNLVYSKLKMKK